MVIRIIMFLNLHDLVLKIFSLVKKTPGAHGKMYVYSLAVVKYELRVRYVLVDYA